MTSRAKRGFTLIEILIVIGIMSVLMTLAVLGFAHFDKVASEKLTKTRLENCQSIMMESDNVQPIQITAAIYYGSPITAATETGNNVVVMTSGTFEVGQSVTIVGLLPATFNGTYTVTAVGAGSFTYVNPTAGLASASSVASGIATCKLSNPGDVTVGSANRYGTAVYSTAGIFQALSHFPTIRVHLAQFPADAMLQGIAGTAGTGGPWLDGTGTPLPVIVDGWKNPIIFIPSSGMSNVYIGGPPQGSMTTGVFGTPKTVVSIDGRPFWASAGADGSFLTGDDNLYSCPVTYK